MNTDTADRQTKSFVNIAYYKFVEIIDPHILRETLLVVCEQLGIKGTILLANEGINSCLAGTSSAIQSFTDFLKSDPRFADIEMKKSLSDHQPFRRMLVKVKKETIPMGKESIKPANFTGKYVEPLELKQWLDAGEDMIVLDTRNDYETDLGTFRGAIDPRIKTFRDFPEWVEKNLAEKKDKKIVTFCTGGIRCEKATAFMREQGFANVYQLHGGILKYFEDTAKSAPNEDNHFDGNCFVFDYRVAVDKNLQETNLEICYNCWSTLTPADLAHPLYKQDSHCPHCVESYSLREAKRQEKMSENNKRALEQRQRRSEQIRATQKEQQPPSTQS